MTRIVVWNLEHFGINKINDPAVGVAANTGGRTYQQASFARWLVVLDTFLVTIPDIIVVIEVASGDNRLSDLASQTGGMNGCVHILNHLNNSVFFNANGVGWGLVPPLRIGIGGKAETVGIFYRRQTGVGMAAVTRYFTGPNIWTGGYNGYAVPPGTAAAAAYPVGGTINIRPMVVPPGTVVRAIPGGAQHNAGVNEDRVAARNRFREDDNGVMGGLLDFSTLREPYMATFTEVDGMGNVRDLTLFAVHSPAVVGDQAVYMNALASVFDITSPLGANETRVVAGDFNLNLLDVAGNYANIYQPLAAHGYQHLLAPAGGPPANLAAYEGYFATHIRSQSLTAVSKFLWSQNGLNQSFYPGYGYVGSNFVPNFYSIDNILVRPFNGGHNYQTTIMNHVTGTPFNGVAMPAGNPPVGTIGMMRSFTNPSVVPWPPAPTAPNWTLGNAMNLRGWANYGHIYGTSDHFALYADV